MVRWLDHAAQRLSARALGSDGCRRRLVRPAFDEAAAVSHGFRPVACTPGSGSELMGVESPLRLAFPVACARRQWRPRWRGRDTILRIIDPFEISA